MRTMYDAVTPANIARANPNPQLVAGYLNGRFAWTQADWDRFPNAVHVGISVRAYWQIGHVLDVETGDATPTESVGWVQARRSAGADPTVYCNQSTWPLVQQAFRNASVAEPHYWIAKYDGSPNIPAGAVAKQYLGDVAPGIDVSSVADYWPGVDGSGPSPTPTPTPAGTDTEVEIMERRTVAASLTTTSVRLLLSGSPGAAIVIRPKIGPDGVAKNPVWIGNIFAWGNDKTGVGHNPKTDGTKDFRLESHRRIELPGAVWADLEYSSIDPFEIDIVG